MEASPLIQAHSHATKAAQLTSSSSQPPSPDTLKEASQEHLLAADLFAKSIEMTTDIEARRTLELMRDHHRKLAKALGDASSVKPPPKPTGTWGSTIIPTRSGSPSPGVQETPTLRRGGSINNETDLSVQAFPPLPHHGPPTTSSNRLGKSTSSLLVSNLASKRGIPIAPSTLSPVLSPATTPGTSVRRGGNDFFSSGQHQRVQPTTNPLLVLPPDKQPSGPMHSQRGSQPSKGEQRQQSPPAEAGFNKFYNSLESFVSRIGSPLAGSLGFAGMDLGLDAKDSPKDSPTHDGELIDGSTVPAHSDKDGYPNGYGVSELVQNLMPKAWFGSQGQGQTKNVSKSKGIFGGGVIARTGKGAWQGGNESYYVVPQSKSGQSLPSSYAAIAGRSTSPAHEVTEDYSPLRPRKTDTSRRTRGPTDGPIAETIPETDETSAEAENSSKTMEELILENQQLRHLTDTLSRRLHTWEVSARDSRAMLDRSLMLYRNKSGEGGSFGSSGGEERTSEREKELQKEIKSLGSKVAQLEAELEELSMQLDHEKKEHERAVKKVNYYKEKWDKLKEGARARELRKQQEGGKAGIVSVPGEAEQATDGTPRDSGSRRASLQG